LMPLRVFFFKWNQVIFVRFHINLFKVSVRLY
jgi:hypothetical protein